MTDDNARRMPEAAVVGARGRARILAGHPWVFREDVLRGPPTDARDGGPAVAAKLKRPFGVAFDAAGDLYISDTFNSRIRKVKR